MTSISHKILYLILFLFCSLGSVKAEIVATLLSGDAKIEVVQWEKELYGLSFYFGDLEIQTFEPDFPIYIEIRGAKLAGRYNYFEIENNELICNALLTTSRKSEISISDKYIAKGNGIFELQRKLDFIKVVSGDNYFNSFFGFITDENSTRLTKNEYFIPGVWYKGNFTATGNLPSHVPNASDVYHYYRADRITLPLVMFRDPATGFTLSIIHKDSDPQTVVADGQGIYINENYQYGSLGIKRENNLLYTTFVYPGSEADRRSGKGYRYHPVKLGITHEYNLEICFSNTTDYADAVKTVWRHAFGLYNPNIYDVDLQYTYDGLIETLKTYYVPSIPMGGIRDAPGFPFEVSLHTFQPLGIDYQMGFVGMQVATGYYLYREGIEKDDEETMLKGKSILDFWAEKCLTSLGFPRTWYDPGLNGHSGSFRNGSDIRVCTGGMEALIAAWCFAKRSNIEPSNAWINSCERFGDWLVENQNSDGSYYFSYNQNIINGGKHPPSNYNKFLTICTIRYLVELYIATGKEEYKLAALRAGNFCFLNIHERYMYVACVVDNPQTIDSESGQMAINGFLSLYDLTKDGKWLVAAEQAATYTESWVYSFEIPVESDRTGATSFPKDRSIVGQHMIAIGHSAADLGFAWCSFVFYRLYLETGNEHYLKIARIAAHNTKQSMNWDQSLYPGRPKGLQLEAFQVMIPRRVNGIMTTLNWNYAAHLDPMFRFKDAFGTPDLEEVELLSWEEKQRLNHIYSQVQSANWGQSVSIKEEITENMFHIFPNPVGKERHVFIKCNNCEDENTNISIYNINGIMVFSEKVNFKNSVYKVDLRDLPEGHYIINLQSSKMESIYKLLLQ